MNVLYSILISPIEFLIELAFVVVYRISSSPGISVIAVSLVVSVLTLPFYNMAEQIQRRERETQKSLRPGVDRIKATFTGDERYLLLSTFYRQKNYHPLYSLRGMVGLLVQIPFFIAAYHFLSTYPYLNNASFWFFHDLGKPDGLLHFGSLIGINILPLIMTALNVTAGVIYSQGLERREKIQLHGTALVFLLLLYNSPSGLVLYWTLNNVFSLIKNIFYRLKNRKKILYILGSISCTGFSLGLFILKPNLQIALRLVAVFVTLSVIAFPLLARLYSTIHRKYFAPVLLDTSQKELGLFINSSLSLALLLGATIPLGLFLASPSEFSFLGNIANPIYYVKESLFLFLGLVAFWPAMFFVMTNNVKVRSFMNIFSLSLLITVLSNIFLFKGNYGFLNESLIYADPTLLKSNGVTRFIPILISGLGFGCIVCFYSNIRMKNVLFKIVLILLVAMILMNTHFAFKLQNEFKVFAQSYDDRDWLEKTDESLVPVFSLSRKQENVITIFLDRAIGSFLPTIVEQFPELIEGFSGFVFFPNTVSPGACTLLGAPSLLGGPEYSPSNMNARVDESLRIKLNEAALVVPAIFAESGYSVSLFDVPYLNSGWLQQSPMNQYSGNITTGTLKGRYATKFINDFPEVGGIGLSLDTLLSSKVPMYSIFQALHPIFRETFYHYGSYIRYLGIANATFLRSYATLHYLPEIVDTMSQAPTYTFIGNDTTHDPDFVQAPDYVPRLVVTDNSTPFDEDTFYNETARKYYHSNVAALKRLAVWFKDLKSKGVYDNTRIIIVSDHGAEIATPVFKQFTKDQEVFALYNPILLIKDFGAKGGLSTDNQMKILTEVPVETLKGLNVDIINPFTGIDMLSEFSTIVDCYDGAPDVKNHNTNTFIFDYAKSFNVRDSIFEETNWTPLKDPVIVHDL